MQVDNLCEKEYFYKIPVLQVDDLVGAEVYINEAIELSKQFPELIDSGIFQANQGMIFIRRGLLDQAKKTCSLAWRMAKNAKNEDGMEQADYCLKQLKNLGV